jgi:hypothetical protein
VTSNLTWPIACNGGFDGLTPVAWVSLDAISSTVSTSRARSAVNFG